MFYNNVGTEPEQQWQVKRSIRGVVMNRLYMIDRLVDVTPAY